MKLIYLTHWRFPSEKTMTPLILRTCAHFARKGIEVELWIPRRRNAYKAKEDIFTLYGIEPRFTVRRLYVIDLMHVLGKAGFLLMVASFNLAAYLQLGKQKRAVLYAHDLRDLILPSFRGLPMFIEIHDFYESSLKFLNRRLFRKAAGLIVTNTHKLEHIASVYGVAHERMLRQPNAVDAAMFDISESQEEARKALGLPADKKIIMYTGHLFSWKGVRTLAEAAALLPENAMIYFVGGTEEDRIDMQRFIADRKLPRIAFVEHQTPEKMPRYMRAADVLVLPNTAKEEASRVETSPVKLFEYLAAGKAIVASDLPSIRDVVTAKEVFFATPDNPADFARAIGEAMNGDSSKTQAGKLLAASHSWEKRAESILALVRRFS